MTRPEHDLLTRLAYHEESLRQWAEPDGLLLPTEPDPNVRELIRLRLRVAIDTLRWVLGEEPKGRNPT